MEDRDLYTPGKHVVRCLGVSNSQHKHVRKYKAACGRTITNYVMEPHVGRQTDVITCVVKKGSRPLWYMRNATTYRHDKRKTLVMSDDPGHVVTKVLTRVTCVNCLDSTYLGIRILDETEV